MPPRTANFGPCRSDPCSAPRGASPPIVSPLTPFARSRSESRFLSRACLLSGSHRRGGAIYTVAFPRPAGDASKIQPTASVDVRAVPGSTLPRRPALRFVRLAVPAAAETLIFLATTPTLRLDPTEDAEHRQRLSGG